MTAGLILIGLGGLLYPDYPLCHPHQFVDCGATFLVEDTVFKGVTVDWHVDEMISAWIIDDFRLVPESTYTGEAFTKYVREAFYEVEKNSYFISAAWQDRPLKVYRWTDMKLEVTDQRKLHFSFTIPFDIPVPRTAQTLRFYFVDETIYIAFFILKNKVSIAGTGACYAAYKVTKTQYDDMILVTFKR